jgi:hypothetical protein
MDIIHFIADTITAALKHGMSTTTLVLVIVALLRIQIIQNMILRRVPGRYRHKDKFEHMQRDINAIKVHLGVPEWDVGSKIGKTAPPVIIGQPRKSLLQQVAYAPVIITRYFTRSKETYHLSQRRMKMKSKLLSRKFLMAVISAALVIANDGLNLGIDQNTVIAFGSIVVAWILGETAIDATRKTPEVANDSKFTTPTEPAE